MSRLEKLGLPKPEIEGDYDPEAGFYPPNHDDEAPGAAPGMADPSSPGRCQRWQAPDKAKR